MASPPLSLTAELAKPSWPSRAGRRPRVVTADHVTQFWLQWTNVWRRV